MASGPVIPITGGTVGNLQQVVALVDLVQDDDFNGMRGIVNEMLGNPVAVFSGNPLTDCWGYLQGGAGVNNAATGNSILALGLAGAIKELQDDVQSIAAFQGQGLRPGSSPDKVVGELITASDWNDIMLDVADLWANRFNAGFVSTSVADSSTRSTWTNTVTCTTVFSFSSANNLHAFFNLGGRLGLSAFCGTTNTNSQAMNTMLTNMGDVFITATGTTGGVGSNNNLGYYDMTTSFQNVFTATPPGGVYSAHSAVVQARRGASNTFEVRIIMTDANDGVVDDAVLNTQVNGIVGTPAAGGSGFVIPTVTTSTGTISGS